VAGSTSVEHADGRELWMLSDRYEVEGIKEFLSEQGITAKSACAAAQFACDCAEGVCEGLLEACRKHASWSLPKYDQASLACVGVRAAGELLRAHATNPYLGRTCDIVEGFKYVERWARANRDDGDDNDFDAVEQAQELVGMLDLSRLPHEFLSKHVRRSALVNAEHLWAVIDASHAREQDGRYASRSMRLKKFQTFTSRLDDKHQQSIKLGGIAVGGMGQEERVAVIDDENQCVHVFSLRKTTHLFTVGKRGDKPGEFMRIYGAVFNGRGELLVGDSRLCTIQVFDRAGRYVRALKSPGAAESLGLSSESDLIVCDPENACMYLLGQDGAILRTVDSPRNAQGRNVFSQDGFSASAGPADNILVLNESCVVLLSNSGEELQMVIERNSTNPALCLSTSNVAVGHRGEIFVANNGVTYELAFLGPHSKKLRSLGNLPSYADKSGMPVVCMDSQGKIIYAQMGRRIIRVYECVEGA
jgi:hypothetical protein